MPTLRKFPKHSLSDALVLPQKIADENAGLPMDRLLLADALAIKPGSSNYRDLLSSARAYGLTEGTEKAKDIGLTPLGTLATSGNSAKKRSAQRKAAATPALFKKFYERFDRAKLPSTDMFPKTLAGSDFGVPSDEAEECARQIIENGRLVGFIRDISGAPHVFFDLDGDAALSSEEEVRPATEPDSSLEAEVELEEHDTETVNPDGEGEGEPSPDNGGGDRKPEPPKAIFIGHGKNTGPLARLEKILSGFQIPYRVAVTEPNLGRPIPTKVKQTMQECGSAILIFTKDELFLNESGEQVWRPSENVVHELGAASYAYEDRIVIFKEDGLNLATNFSSIGYIEFQEDSIEAKTAELLQELIGFGLIKVTPVG